MKLLIPLTCVLVSFVMFTSKISTAQTSTFKLSDYKNPDYLYQTLDMNFGLNSGFTFNNFAYSEENSKNSNSSFSLNSGVGAVYSFYKNSPKTQAEKHISFDAGIGSSSFTIKREHDDSDYKSGSFSYIENLNIIALKRTYNEKQQYFKVNDTLSAFYNGQSNHT